MLRRYPWLAACDQTHYRAMSGEKTNQAHLRDRLVTADLRLSVLLDATDSVGCDAMQTRTRTRSLVYGSVVLNLTRRILNEFSESPAT